MAAPKRLPTRGKGKGYAFIVAHRDYTGDECLKWPLSCDDKGYGIIGHLGKRMRASRFMCIEVHGQPPSGLHYAAHSCGNGHLGCVNPRHLSWKTPTENQLDSVAHGTCSQPGRLRRKLTSEKVAEIRALKGQATQARVAAQYGVVARTIGEIWSGRAWGKKGAPSHRRFSPETKLRLMTEAKRLRNGGLSLEKIANQIGVSRLTARTYINRQP